MTNYNFTPDFNAVPAGPLDFSMLPTIWASAVAQGATITSINGASISKYYSILAGGGKNGGNCCRHRFPAGVGGAAGPGTDVREYLVQNLFPGQPLHLEFDWMFEGPSPEAPNGFAWVSPAGTGGGKLPGKINWGPGPTTPNGAVAMVTWRNPSPVGNPNPTQNVAYLQDLKTGANIQTVNTTPNIVPGNWDHWHIEVLGGPTGYAKISKNGLLVLDHQTGLPDTVLDGMVGIECAFFYGGTSAAAPTTDSYGRSDNIHVYTTTVIDGVTFIGDTMPNTITVGVPQKFQAKFAKGTNPPITPVAQVAFTSLDPTKVTVAPVAGTFDQFLATPLGANADGSAALVGVHCVLPGCPQYAAFVGDGSLAVNSQLVDTLTLTVVP